MRRRRLGADSEVNARLSRSENRCVNPLVGSRHVGAAAGRDYVNPAATTRAGTQAAKRAASANAGSRGRRTHIRQKIADYRFPCLLLPRASQGGQSPTGLSRRSAKHDGGSVAIQYDVQVMTEVLNPIITHLNRFSGF